MREYWSGYRARILTVGLLAFLIHSSKLNSAIIGIDTESLIYGQKDLYAGWLNTGRQGLVLLKHLTGSARFNPYLAGVMTLVFLTVCVTAFLLLWDKASRGTGWPVWAGCALLWIAHPVLVEQFYFSLQSAEICMGILLTALSLWLVHEAAGGGRPWGYALGGLLLMLASCVYQIFTVMYIFGAVTVLSLQSLTPEESADKRRSALRGICPYAAVFLAAFLCNGLITALFFSGSDYLSGQVKWGDLPVRDCVYNIALHVRNALTGRDSIFYSGILGLLFLAGLAMTLILLRQCGLRLLFYYASLMATPFLMTVVCGDAPVVRSQLILPLITGFLAYLDAVMLGRILAGESRRKMRGAAAGCLAALCVLGGFGEAQMSLRLYYTDACRYAQDEATARELIRILEPLIGEDDTPIVVLGSRSFRGNNACVKGEIVGRSIFEHDVDEEPRFYWSTRRVIGFLHTLGYDCSQVPAQNIPYAMEFARDMDVWPGRHSVEHAGDMIVIKLSDF